MIIFEIFCDDSQKAYQNWEIDSQKCAAAFLRPPSATGQLTDSNLDVCEFWELIL
jgi:hypothetical protein